MSIPVALQLYTVRDALDNDFAGTLKKVREMGYEWVELSGLKGADPQDIRRMLEDAGLRTMSSHVPFAEMSEDIDDTIRRYSAVGCQYMAIPWLPEEMRDTPQALANTIERITALGKRVSEAGMTLLYHNHDFEFKTFDGQYVLDILYDSIPAAYLQTQIDTCWVRFSGVDPAEYLLKYAGRAPLVHLKDYVQHGDADGVPYELIGNDKTKGGAKAGFEFCPVGHGVQDMPPILAASEKIGASFVIVEQDRSVGRSSLEAARLSREYLASLGW